MAEAEFSGVTARIKNSTLTKILDYGKAHRLLKRERVQGEMVETVNISATLEQIIEEFFELKAQKVQ